MARVSVCKEVIGPEAQERGPPLIWSCAKAPSDPETGDSACLHEAIVQNVLDVLWRLTSPSRRPGPPAAAFARRAS